jgi:hypothetical protein
VLYSIEYIHFCILALVVELDRAEVAFVDKDILLGACCVKDLEQEELWTLGQLPTSKLENCKQCPKEPSILCIVILDFGLILCPGVVFLCKPALHSLQKSYI